MNHTSTLTIIAALILAATPACSIGSISKLTGPKSNCTEILPVLRSATEYTQRGMNEMNEGKYECAFDDCQKALDAGGKNVDALTCRGGARFKRDDRDGAESDLNEALKLEPNNPVALYQRADFYRQTKRFAKALTDAGKLLELSPTDYQYSFRAKIYAESSDYENAARDLAEAIKLAPQKPRYYGERAEVYRKLGKTDLAAADERQTEKLRAAQ